MRLRHWIAAAALVLLPSMEAGAAELSVFATTDTAAFACPAGGALAQITKTFTPSVAMKLKKVEFFPGVDGGGVVDFAWVIRRHATGAPLYYTQWQHYADPTIPQRFSFDLPPGDWMTIAAGEQIDVWTGCVNYGSSLKHVQLAAYFYGTTP